MEKIRTLWCVLAAAGEAEKRTGGLGLVIVLFTEKMKGFVLVAEVRGSPRFATIAEDDHTRKP